MANLESIRIIVALAARYDLELDQMDVTGAYLNGKLEEEIYLAPPEEVGVRPRHCWRNEPLLLLSFGESAGGRSWRRRPALGLVPRKLLPHAQTGPRAAGHEKVRTLAARWNGGDHRRPPVMDPR